MHLLARLFVYLCIYLFISLGLAAGLVSKGFPAFGASQKKQAGVFDPESDGLGGGGGDLPCGCVAHWLPVCANNGRTFHSECLAR